MYKYFSHDELKCKCGCEEQQMDAIFMALLDDMREELGFPFHLTSAYRCPDHNEKVSSTGRAGPHTTGRAVDIAANGSKKYAILEAARKRGMCRFGIGKSFVHIDNLGKQEGFPRGVLWTY